MKEGGGMTEGRRGKGVREETGGSTEGMDELMDYECLVPNVSGVFAALTSERGRNLLNQSEVRVFLPTPVVRLPATPDCR